MIRPTEVNGAGASGLMNRLEAARTRPINLKSITLAAFLMASAVMLMHMPFTQAESGDEAIWDYVAQSVLRGQVPYRDVIEIKSPGSAYLSALAIAAGRLLGTRDVIAVRVWEVILVGLLSALTFLVAEAYLKSSIAALIASLIPLMSNPFAEWMVAGTQAKLPMIAFGMLSLLLIAKDRPFWAGFCSMISCLCWQPGLLFAGVSFLIFSRYFTRWRDMKALKVAAGTIAPPRGYTVVFLFERRGGRSLAVDGYFQLQRVWTAKHQRNRRCARPSLANHSSSFQSRRCGGCAQHRWTAWILRRACAYQHHR